MTVVRITGNACVRCVAKCRVSECYSNWYLEFKALQDDYFWCRLYEYYHGHILYNT